MTRYILESLLLTGTTVFILWLVKTLISDWRWSKAQIQANKYRAALRLIASSSSELGPGIAADALQE